ncbi:hypothetical protein ABE61_01855 [Lysinibacillus sphaericus]|uniref:hypothetical protein n=1 Tax=Lysinibacillus sphaericus TaxID=1421 RepID=UPI0018CD962D|nr:hypothetical protein [Lysinibacillus sphaericus]MBG9452862.1 hypothetical protein [Lysinibacillus sphaericus]MBG9480069.1 hypothetical protein [Lysinibacillus sphaericus]MBG9593739.1 hypothetical protein [Lysinibacillus sphaericus]
MSISNPQYAFLEIDFHNPNLTQAELKVENISEGVRKNNDNERVGNTKIALKIISPNVYIKLNWMIAWLLWIPVDIYCATALVVDKFLS